MSTIVFLTLLIPGLLFRRLYFSEEFSKEYFKQGFFETFFAALIPSLLLHSVWLMFFSHCLGYQFDLESLSITLSGSENSNYFKDFENKFPSILIYNSTLAILSAVLGYFLRKLVRVCKWDRKFKFFRFKNSWHYILNGEFFDFPNSFSDLDNTKVEDIEIIYLDVLVDTSEGRILYGGLFVDYQLSPSMEPEYLVVQNAVRQKLNLDETVSSTNVNNDCKKEINGNVLVLPFDQVKNLNLSYYKIEDIKDVDGKYRVQLVS